MRTRPPAMNDIWLHIGMPKAGSTAIQAALWKNFSDRDPVLWLPSDVRDSLGGPEVLEQCLNAHSESPSGPVDVPLALRCGNLTIASSEEYVFSGPHHLAGDALTGMAVIREPSGWALSAAGENLIRTFPLRPELALTLLSSLDPDDPDAQLEAVVSTSIVGYRAQLENVRAWCLGARWFDVVVYRPGFDLVGATASSLERHHCTFDRTVTARLVRVSAPFANAQLALGMLLSAVHDFGLEPDEAAQLSQSALGVEPEFLRANSVAPRPSTVERLNDELRAAHMQYEELVRDFASSERPVPFVRPEMSVLERSFARQFVRSAVRLALRRAILPANFDADQYLASNPDVRGAALRSTDPAGFARRHYEEHGAFETRSAPVRN